MALAKRTARRMQKDAFKIEDEDKRKIQQRHAIDSEDLPSLKKMLEAAQSEPALLASVKDFDADPLLLNCGNGVLDLRTGRLLEHKPDLHLTKLANVRYDSTAIAPLWEEFVKFVLPDSDIATYLQRWFGYCLTGLATEQAILFLVGDGQNGKSTATSTLHKILGDYAQTVNAATMIRKDKEAIRNDLADLKNIRYGMIAEYPENKPLDEAFVKSATGGENIRARHLYNEAFEYLPAFKAVVSTNYKPIVVGSDYGIWRRIKLIHFGVRIPEERKDKDFMGKLYSERSGILNWLLRGCLDWQKLGLQEPSGVTEGIKEYRNEMDVIAQFLNECLVSAPGEAVAATAVHDSYKKWCALNGHSAKTQKKFGTEVTKRGINKGKDAKGCVTYTDHKLEDSGG